MASRSRLVIVVSDDEETSGTHVGSRKRGHGSRKRRHGSRNLQDAVAASRSTNRRHGSTNREDTAATDGSRKRQEAVVTSATRKYTLDDDEESEEDDEEYDEEAHVQSPPPQCVRGPNISGFCSFDNVCIFANYMRMNADLVGILKKQARDYPVPAIKHYVYKMTESCVAKNKCKMIRFI